MSCCAARIPRWFWVTVFLVCLYEGIDCQVGGIPFVRKKKHRAHGVLKIKNVCESPSKKEQQKETTEQVTTKSANKRQSYMNPRIFECAQARTPAETL